MQKGEFFYFCRDSWNLISLTNLCRSITLIWIMKVSTFALASSLALCHSNAFSLISYTSNPKSAPRCVPLAAEKSNNLKADFAKGAASFATAVAIGCWGVTRGASAAEILPQVQPSFSL